MAQLSSIKKLTDEESLALTNDAPDNLAATDNHSTVLSLELPSEETLPTKSNKMAGPITVDHSGTNWKNCCNITTGCFVIVVYTAFQLAMPTAMMVIGIKYQDQCPINSKIPQYLIVTSVINTVYFIFNSIKKLFQDDDDSDGKKLCYSCILVPIGICSLIWIILGSVWTFSANSLVQYDDPTNLTTYCHPTLYLFTFVTLIVGYGIIALTFFLAFGCGCLVCLISICKSS